MKTNAYRGFSSTTFVFVMLGFVTGTALLVGGFIDSLIWKDGVLGLLTGYVIRAAVGSVSEAYVATRTPTTTPGG